MPWALSHPPEALPRIHRGGGEEAPAGQPQPPLQQRGRRRPHLPRLPQMDDVREANGSFAIKLFKVLGEEDESQNIFFSPISIFSSMSMVYLGTRGNTAAQLSQALCLDGAEDVHGGFQLLLSDVNQTDHQNLLRMANKLFGEETSDFLSSFKESCQKFYQAGLEELSFVNESEDCRKRINAWVSERTEGKISEVLGPGSITSQTKMVLVNAVYFKGKWSEQFDRKHTRDMLFKTKEEKKTVKMMFKKAKFKMGDIPELHTQVLELPYMGEELSMFILLPDENTDLAVVEEVLTYEKLKAWISPDNLTKSKVQVFLPRLKMEKSYELKASLERLGITDAFDETKADFSGMSSRKNVPLSKVAHKCFVEVNEEGTEAAGATAVVRNTRSARLEPTFRADHPFLFFIWSHPARSILFCGRFCSP